MVRKGLTPEEAKRKLPLCRRCAARALPELPAGWGAGAMSYFANRHREALGSRSLSAPCFFYPYGFQLPVPS
jgi:hypothetical protein